jgi:hypothetical protein
MKLEEYNALVMNEAYNVVGNIQHYATRGIDGGLPAYLAWVAEINQRALL